VWMLRRSYVCARSRVAGHIAAECRRQVACAIDVPKARLQFVDTCGDSRV
jgi:hypothetical protein